MIAVGNKVPHTASDVPASVALLLASYPLIDVVASVLSSTYGDARLLRINAGISSLSAIGVAVIAFGSDAAATLVAFGAWASVSGAIQALSASAAAGPTVASSRSSSAAVCRRSPESALSRSPGAATLT